MFSRSKGIRRLLVTAGLAFAAVPVALPAPSPAAADAAGFEAAVRPFLAKSCQGCHNNAVQSGGLNLQTGAGLESVVSDPARWQLVLEKIQTAQMPPKGAPAPPEPQKQAVIRWLTTELDRQDRALPPNPGRVTARRLNRTEYGNTVRDLFAADLPPAIDFPPDDSGYGFDNIGDVLSMSPALMERYVAAADKIVRAALYGPPALKPTLVKHEPWYVDFATKPEVKTEYDETGLSLPSALHVMHRFPVEGDYDIAGLLRGTRPSGSDPLSVAFWVDGKQVQVMEYSIPPGGEVSGQRRQFRIHVPAGEHWLAASFLRVYEGLPPVYKGPKPTTRPDAAPRVVRTRPSSGALPRGATTAFFVSNLEIIGPYNQALGPSQKVLRQILTCGHADGKHTASCPRKILPDFASRAYRRPVTRAEVNQLTGLFDMARAEGEPFLEAIGLALQKVLISPHFLFRIEREQVPAKAAIRPLTDHELATRLSYFLWSSMPDAALRQIADQGRLRKPGVLGAQIARMLQDPKAHALVENFGGQWLEFRGLESHLPDRKKFQEYTEYTRMSIARETEHFFAHIMREDRPVLDFLNAPYTFLNERLAAFYGIPGVTGPEFRKVDLNGTNRRGVLTHASVLTVSSYANRTSPVVRGKWILENMLNAPPPPPPPDVPSLDETTVGTTASLREQLEKHRASAVCASCHSRMDPLGFSLENFDAIGQWRTTEGKFPIDASGQLPDGRKFQGALGLTGILESDPRAFAQAMTEKMLTYALGRGLERHDRPAVRRIVDAMEGGEYRFSLLVTGIVDSLPFQQQSTSSREKETAK